MHLYIAALEGYTPPPPNCYFLLPQYMTLLLKLIILSSLIITLLRYDPASDSWSPVVAMNSRRSGVGLSVVNGKLYATGGFDGATYLKSVEWFDQNVNRWEPAASMNYRRLGCGVGVLKLTSASDIAS